MTGTLIRRIVLVFWLVVVTLSPALGATRATVVPGSTLSTNTTWSLAGSPYDISGIVTLQAGATLTVEPGVEVRFGANAGLVVAGTLQAEGTFDGPIVFTGASKTPGAWRGIIVQGTSAVPAQARLRYATVEYGGVSGTGDGLYLEHARATITNSTFRAAGRHGLYAASDARADIADSTFVNNGNAALRLLDLSQPSVVERLTASGNGQNVVALGGAGAIIADDTWERAGIPYRIDGLVEVRAGAMLMVAPGTEIRFAPNQMMQVKGALQAVGTSAAPIVFTGATPTPGSWQGLVVYGTPNVPATAVLEHVTLEYGGFGSSGGNIYVNNGAIAIRDSIVRRSAGSGIVLWSNASSSSVTRSQIVENANYGLYQPSGSAWQAVLASNNWWGHPSGPAPDNSCNPDGQGARVSSGVAFMPFLGAADAQPGPAAPSEARQLTIKPDRWFAAASGAARIYVEITLRDGAGKPLAGRTVKLHSTRGSVVDGGITDVQGHTFASLVSTAAGDALLTAELDLDGTCEYARSGQTTVTFTAVDTADMLGSDPPAPYINPHLSIAPRPLTRGVPTTVSATLSNPGDAPLVVEGRFSYAQSGIGLAFGPIGAPQTLTIAPHSTVTFATTFTPPIEGHFCIRFEYTYSTSALSLMSQWGNGGDLQENYEFRAPPLPKPLNKWEDTHDPSNSSQPPNEDNGGWFDWITKFPQRFTDFDNNGDNGDNNGDNGGNNGLNAAGLERATSAAADFRHITPPRELVLPERQPSGAVTQAIADAQNQSTRALAIAIVNLEASYTAAARYDVATQARDVQWASLQASAAGYYEAIAGQALVQGADALDAYAQALMAAGVTSLPVTAQEAQAYQNQIRTSGFSAEKVAELRLLGMTDAQIDAYRQEVGAIAVSRVTGDQLARIHAVAASFRSLGQDILRAPAFANPAAAGRAAATSQLANVADVDETILVGNPFATPATIDMRVRMLDLPPDWIVSVTPAQFTLQPGQQQQVKVKIVPGTAVQGSSAQVAVEGYTNGSLIDGVAFNVAVPEQRQFSAGYTVYLPSVSK